MAPNTNWGTVPEQPKAEPQPQQHQEVSASSPKITATALTLPTDLDYYYDYPELFDDKFDTNGGTTRMADAAIVRNKRIKNSLNRRRMKDKSSYDEGFDFDNFDAGLDAKKGTTNGAAASPDVIDYDEYGGGLSGFGVSGFGGGGNRRRTMLNNGIRRGGGGGQKIAKVKPFNGGYGHFEGGHGYNVAYGHGGGSGYGGHGNNVVIVKKKRNKEKDGLLDDLFGDMGLDFETFALGLAAVGAIAGFTLFQTITMNGRKKRRRDFGEDPEDGYGGWLNWLSDTVWTGLEDFEGKIDKLAQGEPSSDEDSWINKLYQNFVANEQIEEDELIEKFGEDALNQSQDQADELDPPLLVQDGANSMPKSLDRARRSLMRDESEVVRKIYDTPGSCSMKFWKCISGVAWDGLKFMKEPEGFQGALKKRLLKIVFKGGSGKFWEGLMSVPEARQIQRCYNKDKECKSFEVLKKEAKSEQETPQRLLIVPEEVENQDSSDGSEQWSNTNHL